MYKKEPQKDKCVSCPLAEVLQMAIAVNKRMAIQRLKEYKPIKSYKHFNTILHLN